MAPQIPRVCCKIKSIWKSYLDKFCGLRNMRNRSSMLELLFLAPKNTFKLLLSSEIDQFDVEEVDFPENPYIFLCTNTGNSREFNGK